MLLIVKQILLVDTFGKVYRILLRIWVYEQSYTRNAKEKEYPKVWSMFLRLM